MAKYNSLEFYKAVTQIAKKEHVCADCKKTIEKGTRYETMTGKYEGEFYNIKQCTNCTSKQ